MNSKRRGCYRYITICQKGDELFNNMPVYRIYNNKRNHQRRSKEQIGILSYDKLVKEYVFNFQDDCIFNSYCIFNSSCLKDIINFINCMALMSQIYHKHIHNKNL